MHRLLSSPTTTETIRDFTLRWNKGSSVGSLFTPSLSTFAGRPVVLLIFGVDCGNCAVLARILSEFKTEYAEVVQFAGVCVQSGCWERLPEFHEKSLATIPLASCSSRELRSALGIAPSTWLFYPTLVFIDHKQRIRGCFVGGDSFFEEVADNLKSAVDGLLTEMENSERHEQADERVEVEA